MTVCLVQQDSLCDQSLRPDTHRTYINPMTDFQQLAARQSLLSLAALAQQQAALLGLRASLPDSPGRFGSRHGKLRCSRTWGACMTESASRSPSRQ